MEDPLGLVGTVIDDKYQVESLVGEGGFAIVYKATHILFKRPVAIKAFRALSDFGLESRDRLMSEFVQEGRLLAELSERSAAIVQARDIGTLITRKGDWIPYMVLEWLEGASLEQVFERENASRLPPRTTAEAIDLLEPIAEALSLAHKIGIAHRDVKPANMFIIGDPRGDDAVVKLLDFGIAKVVQDVQKLGGSFQKTSGVITSFTPGYAAPEQFSRTHGSTGPWTDVFAFALVVTEAVAGRQALSGDTLVQVGYASSDPYARPTPRACGAVVSDQVEAVFAKALAVAIADRHQTAAEFWVALREAAGLAAPRAPAFGGLTRPGATSPPHSVASVRGVDLEKTQAVAASEREAPALGTTGTTVTPSAFPQPNSPAGRSRAVLAVAALVALAAAAAAGVALVGRQPASGPSAQPAPSAPPVAAAAPAKLSCPKGMALVEGGDFYMGSSDLKALDNEKPSHSVSIGTYCIDLTEVTVEAYKACSDVGKCPPAGRENAFDGLDEPLKKITDPLCNIREPSAKASHPINCVDWEMAANYCAKAGGHLPTEAEWEYAARGPDGRAYPWGDDAPGAHFLNACGSECMAWGKKNRAAGQVTFAAMYPGDDGFANTAPVGSFPEGRSRFGLSDVVGNVWEWTGDFYAQYTKDAQKDPTGPKSGEEGRVARGGAWNGGDPSWVRPTFRFHFAPGSRSYGVGFRCAHAPQ